MNTNINFINADVFDDVLKDEFFDFIWCNGVLHHTKNAEEAFKCLVEVTKPGGILVIGLYHRYGRILTRFKQKLAKILGDKISYFDKFERKYGKKDAKTKN